VTVGDTDSKPITRREFDLVIAGHNKEHDLHDKAHHIEHEMTEAALVKADSTLETRLEGMNEFRSQLEKQAGQFLNRESFDQQMKEYTLRNSTAIETLSDKYDAIINAMVNRHDADTEGLKEQIQTERELRKEFQGSINTWKWIATFLGASGVGGVILLFITRFTQ